MLTPTQVALNSTPLTVTKRDGTAETVQVRQLDIEGLYLYIDCLSARQMPKVMAHACGRDTAWLNTLSARSAAALAKLVSDQNFTDAMEIIQQDPIAAISCSKLLAELTAGFDLLRKSSPDLSGAPAPLASPEVTGSESSSSPQGA